MREWLTTEIVCRMLVLDIPHTDLAEVIMVRIGINIPNELMKRLEPLKRELNISQVCREALTAKAEGHERMLSRLENDDVALAIDRHLEQEKELLAAISFDWQTLGWEDAACWVKAASDDNWNDFLEDIAWLDENDKPHWEIRPLFIDGVKHLHHREMELHGCMEQARQRNPGFDRWLRQRQGGIDYQAIKREYMTAWTAYISAVWERYRQPLVEYLETVEKERLEAWRNRPRPDVPAHMLADFQRQTHN